MAAPATTTGVRAAADPRPPAPGNRLADPAPRWLARRVTDTTPGSGPTGLWPLWELRVRTPRLELVYPDDDTLCGLAEAAAGGVHDPEAMPFATPWTDAPADGTLQRNLLTHHWRLRAETAPESWTLPLAVVVEGRPVGVQALTARRFATLRSVTTGSWLARSHQGRGLGVEMRSAVLHLAFAGLGALVAHSAAFVDNPASAAVSRRCGYVPNGWDVAVQRDRAQRVERFVLTRAGWERRQRSDIVIGGLEACLALLGAEGPPLPGHPLV